MFLPGLSCCPYASCLTALLPFFGYDSLESCVDKGDGRVDYTRMRITPVYVTPEVLAISVGVA